MVRRCLIIDPKDTVAVLLENAQKGDLIDTPRGKITLLDTIEFAHKAAIVNHEINQKVYKYGHEIGYMASPAPSGTWIHNHNMRCDRGKQPASTDPEGKRVS